MKYLILFFFCALSAGTISAQRTEFTSIDSLATTIGFHAPDTLARLLTKPYATDLQKVRSIFYWITQHIGYDIAQANEHRSYYFTYVNRDDSLRKRKERVKESVRQTFGKRKGVCEDYANIFNTLCEYAKIKSVMVTGYSRSISDSIGHEKQDDHAWNAVMIDNEWRLIDVTWASGYCDDRTATFNKRYNDYYFLTDPELMQLNHYPTDSKWLLTKSTMSLNDFFDLPNIYFDQTDTKMHSFFPHSGIINVRQGETIKFILGVSDTTKNVRLITYPNEVISPDYTSTYMDKSHPSISVPNTQRHYIQVNNDVKPVTSNEVNDIYNYLDKQKNTKKAAVMVEKYDAGQRKVVRNYVVSNARLQTILIVYNDEPMLQYRINIIK